MKKVLTLTTQYSPNNGALLQCYALSKFISSQDDLECEVIQYWHPNARAGWRYFKKVSTLRDVVFNLYMLCRPDLLWQKRQRNKKYAEYIKEFLPLNKTVYTTDEAIRQNPPSADVYVVGSDQIWNLHRKGIGTVYFLDFVPEGKKKIAYAASMGVKWTADHCNMVKPFLEKFDAISVREEGHISLTKKASGKDVAHVADPVFLLGKDEWEKLAVKPTIDEPYIFCFFFGVTELAAKAVKKLRETTGYKVVYLNYNALDKLGSDKDIRACGPNEFLGLIANAEIVCTSSFHTSAFATIFRKDLFYVPQAESERGLSLLRTCGISEALVTDERLESLTMQNLHIDYSAADATGKAFIDKSKKFLLDAIYERK